MHILVSNSNPFNKEYCLTLERSDFVELMQDIRREAIEIVSKQIAEDIIKEHRDEIIKLIEPQQIKEMVMAGLNQRISKGVQVFAKQVLLATEEEER